MLPQTWDALVSDTRDSLAAESLAQVSNQVPSAWELSIFAIEGGFMIGVFGSMLKS